MEGQTCRDQRHLAPLSALGTYWAVIAGQFWEIHAGVLSLSKCSLGQRDTNSGIPQRDRTDDKMGVRGVDGEPQHTFFSRMA